MGFHSGFKGLSQNNLDEGGSGYGASLLEEAPWRGPRGELLHWGLFNIC